MYDIALQRYHDDELKKIEEIGDVPLAPGKFINLKKILLDKDSGILNDNYNKSTPISDLFGYSFLWKDGFDPVPDCTNQSFGVKGQWNNTICNTIETLREASM